jgi:hypothetical protein
MSMVIITGHETWVYRYDQEKKTAVITMGNSKVIMSKEDQTRSIKCQEHGNVNNSTACPAE